MTSSFKCNKNAMKELRNHLILNIISYSTCCLCLIGNFQLTQFKQCHFEFISVHGLKLTFLTDFGRYNLYMTEFKHRHFKIFSSGSLWPTNRLRRKERTSHLGRPNHMLVASINNLWRRLKTYTCCQKGGLSGGVGHHNNFASSRDEAHCSWENTSHDWRRTGTLQFSKE